MGLGAHPLYLLLLGLGLLADRLLRAEVPAALLAPLGLGVAIVLVTPVYRFGLSAAVALPLLLIAAARGPGSSRGASLRERAWAPVALGAAGAVYVLHMLPVALSGDPTWAGYNFVNDTAANFVLIDLLEHHGAQRAPTADSTTTAWPATSPPPATRSARTRWSATVRPLTGVPIEARLPAVPGGRRRRSRRCRSRRSCAARDCARPARRRRRCWRWAGSCSTATRSTARSRRSCSPRSARPRRRSRWSRSSAACRSGVVVLIAVCCLAMVFAFSAAAGVYALGLAVGRPRCGGHRARSAGLAPSAPAGARSARASPWSRSCRCWARRSTSSRWSPTSSPRRRAIAQDASASSLRPLPVTEAAGVWLARDYRMAVESAYDELNALLVAVAVADGGRRVSCSASPSGGEPLILLGTVALPGARPRAVRDRPTSRRSCSSRSPRRWCSWRRSRASFARPAGRDVAARGAGGWRSRPWRRRAGLGPLRLPRDASCAPLGSDGGDGAGGRPHPRRWAVALQRVGGVRQVLHALGAHQRRRRARLAEAGAAANDRSALFGRWFDLDAQQLSTSRASTASSCAARPEASRPPASFRRIYRNRYYELWQRDPNVRGAAASAASRALPRDRSPPACRDGRGRSPATREPAIGSWRRARPPVASLSPLLAERPTSWSAGASPSPGTVVPSGPGTMSGDGDHRGRAGGRSSG